MTNTEFRDIRLSLILTQKQLANALGYAHRIRISEFERETNPVKIPAHIAAAMRQLRDTGRKRRGKVIRNRSAPQLAA